MRYLKQVIISFLLCLTLLFLSPESVFAGCTEYRPTNPGAAQNYPTACADGKHFCESSQECAFNQYDTPPIGGCPGNCVPAGNCVNIIYGYAGVCNPGYECCQGSLNLGTTTPQESPQGKCDEGEINTALGCISTDATSGGLIGSILELAIGLGGATALALMLYGFYIITTSAGIPDKVKAGQEIITSAVGGLLFIIFAVVLMQLIGVKILQLPGLQ